MPLRTTTSLRRRLLKPASNSSPTLCRLIISSMDCLQEGFLYSLTGATGAGKTAITLRLAASIALGVVFAGRETKRRRVLYLAAENPDDVRMRWIALSQHMDFDMGAIEVFFVEGVFKMSRQTTGRDAKKPRSMAATLGMVIIDTSPVFYEGDDENNRTQQGQHAVMLRELIGVIPGKPAVVANCHPSKERQLPIICCPQAAATFSIRWTAT